MKTIKSTLAVLMLGLTITTYAQQVNTLYFLENAPMRHLINPAFQPVSNGYINFTPLGYMSFWAGNDRATMSDFIYKDPVSGKTVIALNPYYGNKEQLLKTLGKSITVDFGTDLDLLSFGFRYKEKGYIHIGIMEHIEGGFYIPSDMYQMIFNSSVIDPKTELTNELRLGFNGAIYTSIGGGYSHIINEHWTVGGKVKFLLGQGYAGSKFDKLDLISSATEMKFQGDGNIYYSAPIQMPNNMSYADFTNDKISTDGLSVMDFVKPAGYGASFDLGFTYKPIKQVQITAALTDLGFICWKGGKYKMNMDTTFYGVGDFEYSDYVIDGKFNGDTLLRDVESRLLDFAKGIHANKVSDTYARMTTMRLNVGVDANFCNNILGIGLLSRTTLYNGRLYEEVTLGGAIRPCNWFNLAVSYSLVENGKYSNIGAGLSFMPYDGINLTLAMDYIPTSYAPMSTNANGQPDNYFIPYKTQGMNVALGFSIVWGTNKKDSDKDGVRDPYDMCPKTPKNVKVDALGCPLDSDGDGVPDYLDQCPGTRPEAYGFVDSVGCPLDSDGDGVYDWKDQCPGTPAAAIGYVDENGCALDSDGDGVADYLDQCPNTPAEARGYVDANGCELDTDMDGVPDWKDQCPNTPAMAIGYVDSIGCELDTDGDSVPDWKDQCPNTPAEARGYIDSLGCELDTDKDGVPDWRDECPTVAGLAYNKGCPEVKKEIRNLLKKAMQGIQFETGKATIKKVSYPLLDQIAQNFIDNSNYIIEVQGHTDNVGKAALNKKLSQDRAESVMNYLIKAGVPQQRLSAVGFGSEVPVADNKTKAGRAQNRRVEFHITFEEVTYETVLEHLDTDLYQEYQDSINATTDSVKVATDSISTL